MASALSPDALNKVQQHWRDLPVLRAGHVAVPEAAVLCGQRKHSCDLDLEHFPPAAPLHVFALLQSIVDDRLQLLHQVPGGGRADAHRALAVLGELSPEGMWMHQPQGSNSHLSDFPVPADKGDHAMIQVPCCERPPSTGFQTQGAVWGAAFLTQLSTEHCTQCTTCPGRQGP